MSRPTSALGLIAILALATSASADVRLPGLISDHMVLQRDMPARIFGRADPGEAVSVSFRGRTARAVADPLGRWEVWLDPLSPGPAADMTISGANTLTVRDVLVGDVWIGSGQSNMQWSVRQSANAEAEIAAANCPQLRLFYVPRRTSPVPVEDVDAKWVVCTPETVGAFSAVLYYFGREMHTDLKVPMGLVHSSWGGTPIASWISGSALVGDSRLDPFLAFWQNVIRQYPANQIRHEQALKKWETSGAQSVRPAPPLGPGHQHEPTTLYNAMIAPLVKYTIKGALWYQGETEAGGRGRDDRHRDRSLPRPREARGGRHGTGLPRARHQAQSRRGAEDRAAARRGRSRAVGARRPRGADARGPQSPLHRAGVRRR
jgi:sialate O-acetylesterase